jgi:hypothetical protein
LTPTLERDVIELLPDGSHGILAVGVLAAAGALVLGNAINSL